MILSELHKQNKTNFICRADNHSFI
jgi:hypothetical protein